MHDPETGLGMLVVAGLLWTAMALLHQEHGWFRAYVGRIVLGLVIGRLVVEALRLGWNFQPDTRARAALWLVIFCLPLLHALAIEAWLTYKAMIIADYGRLLTLAPVRTYNRRHQKARRPMLALNR